MPQEPTQQWRCQVCKRIFQDEDMLLGHTKSIEVRSQLVLERMHQLMNEYQGLMKSWQEVLTHSESGSTSFDYDTSNDNDSNILELSCPHPDCAAMPQTYTELRSLQRHFRNHVKFIGSCPSCKVEFDTTGRLHETHLQRCLKIRGTKDSREEATIQKQQIATNAKRELKRLRKYRRIRKPTGKAANMDLLVPDDVLPQVATSQIMEDINLFSRSAQQPSMLNDGRFEAVPGLIDSQPVLYSRGTAFDGCGRFPLDWSTQNYYHQNSEPATLFPSSSGNSAGDLVKVGLDMGNLT